MIRLLYRSASSACFELENTAAYHAPEAYTVYLDGQPVKEGDTNVFSLYGLKPDTEYTVRLSGGYGETGFRTAQETCCVNVKDFGAAGDGVHEDTEAIRAAITALPAGGRLFFPAGTYLTLPVTLKSHMTMELSEGAVLLASPDRQRFPVIPGETVDPVTGKKTMLASFEGLVQTSYQSILHAAWVKDVTIIGPGTVDGNAQNAGWWVDFKSFPASRPRLFFSICSEDITFHGVHVKDSPSWNMHPFFSKGISFLDLDIQAPKISPNTDGMDPESCDGVNIIGCRISVGDDCIAIKSGKIELAQRYHMPSDHITIRNCLMQFGHGAVTLGSELAAGIRNLDVTQCLFRNTDRGLRIKSRRGRGKESIVTNVLFDNIVMENVLTPIVLNMWYNCVDPDAKTEYVWSREKLPVDDRTPHLGTFCFKNMVCTGAEVAACYIDGLPESTVDEVALENISISFAEDAKPGIPAMENFAKERLKLGLYFDNVEKVRLKNVSLKGVIGEKLITAHCGEVETENFTGES